MKIWLIQEEHDGIPAEPEPFLNGEAMENEVHARICDYYDLDATITDIDEAFDLMCDRWSDWGVRTYMITIPNDAKDFSDFLKKKYQRETP